MADRAVFLDRDNTLTADPGYLADPTGVRLLPGVPGAMKALKDAGYKLVLVTNQSGIARGLLTEEALQAIHKQLQRRLDERGAALDAIYTCPFHPDGTVEPYNRESDERKPGPGMLLRAAKELDLDLAASWMVGDRSRDILAGRAAGCRTIRVLTGTDEGEETPAEADFTSANLVEAVRVILSGGVQGGRVPTRKPNDVPSQSPPAAPDGTVAEAAWPSPPEAPAAADSDVPTPSASPPQMSNNEILAELLRLARQSVGARREDEFNLSKLAAGICQGLAVLAFALGMVRFLPVSEPLAASDAYWTAIGWFAAAGVLQLMAMTFFALARRG